MKKLKEEYISVLEAYGWTVSSYTDDGRVEIEQYSPAGENFSFCVEVEYFPARVMEYYMSFDIDEHVETWIEAKKNGTAGVPSAVTLVRDATAIDKMLEELADALAEVEA